MNYKEAKLYVEKNNLCVGDTVILEPYNVTCEYIGLESEAINDGMGYVQIDIHSPNAEKVPFNTENDHWRNKGYSFHKKVELTHLSKVT